MVSFGGGAAAAAASTGKQRRAAEPNGMLQSAKFREEMPFKHSLPPLEMENTIHSHSHADGGGDGFAS